MRALLVERLAPDYAGCALKEIPTPDPGPGEGTPARLHEVADGLTLRGAKTFCSGAGGVDAALIMVGNDGGLAPSLVLVECDEAVEVDRSWYRAAGLRASESHRVNFHDAPVVAVLGAGSWGTTIAHVVASTGRPCVLWSRDAEVARESGDPPCLNGRRKRLPH